MAKPTATGVNELRPPDAMAAHQAASTSSPDASPTPSVSPAGASASQEPDEAGDPDAEQQADRAEQQALADRQPDRAVGQGDPELRQHPPDYTVGLRRPSRDPTVSGSCSTCVSPLVAIGMASGHERVRMDRVDVDVVDAVGLQEGRDRPRLTARAADVG